MVKKCCLLCDVAKAHKPHAAVRELCQIPALDVPALDGRLVVGNHLPEASRHEEDYLLATASAFIPRLLQTYTGLSPE